MKRRIALPKLIQKKGGGGEDKKSSLMQFVLEEFTPKMVPYIQSPGF